MNSHETRPTVLVTGGSGGIGGGICTQLSKQWNVAVHYRSNKEAAEGTVKELLSEGCDARAFQADLTEEDSVKGLFDRVVEQFDSLDAVVANAGIGGFQPIVDSDLNEFQKMIDVNIVGSYLTIREAARRVSDGGKIVFVSSQLAERPRAASGMYSACKAAIDAMLVSMSHEVGTRGISINAVRPGATEPGMFADSTEERKDFFRELSPFKRLGNPEDIAGVVSFLLSENSRWMTGQHLRADGGASN